MLISFVVLFHFTILTFKLSICKNIIMPICINQRCDWRHMSPFIHLFKSIYSCQTRGSEYIFPSLIQPLNNPDFRHRLLLFYSNRNRMLWVGNFFVNFFYGLRLFFITPVIFQFEQISQILQHLWADSMIFYIKVLLSM